MPKKRDITLAVYFAEGDPASLRTLAALEECVARCGTSFNLRLKKAAYDSNREAFERNGVLGVPVVDVGVGEGRMRRFYGEQSVAELEAAIRGYSKGVCRKKNER